MEKIGTYIGAAQGTLTSGTVSLFPISKFHSFRIYSKFLLNRSLNCAQNGEGFRDTRHDTKNSNLSHYFEKTAHFPRIY